MESVTQEISEKLSSNQNVLQYISTLISKYMQNAPPTNISIDFNHSFNVQKTRSNSIQSLINAYGEIASGGASVFYSSPMVKNGFQIPKPELIPTRTHNLQPNQKTISQKIQPTPVKIHLQINFSI